MGRSYEHSRQRAGQALQASQITVDGDKGTALRTLLCDLMHLADADGTDFAAELAKARKHYHAETGDRPASDDTYQGWRNRETWVVGLHLNNEQAAYDVCRALSRNSMGNRHHLADRLESYVVSGYLLSGPGMTPLQADLMEAAIARIDFFELAEDLLQD